jgi:hypothetical protein
MRGENRMVLPCEHDLDSNQVCAPLFYIACNPLA